MRNKIFGILAGVFCIFSLVNAQNLVQNGGFEQPVISGCGFGTSCAIPSWTVTGCGGAPNLIIPACNSGTPDPIQGNQALQIYSATGSGFMTISQTINVTPGCTYRYRFHYSSVFSPRECIDWTLTGGFGGTVNGNNTWQLVDFNFTPSTPTVTITFTNTATALCAGSTNSFNYTSPQLDNVILELVDCNNPVEPDTTSSSITGCDSVVFAGNTYFTNDTVTFNGTNAGGADSTHFTFITVNNSSTTNLTQQICDGDVVTIGSQSFTSAGVYQVTLPANNGCDSTVNLDLSVIPAIGAAPDGASFNTGNNGTGGTLPGGSNDLNWQVAETNINNPYFPAVVMSSTPAVYYNSPWPDAAWIAHNATGNHVGDMDYFYRVQFDLACQDICGGNYTDPDVFCLNLDFFTDNSVFEIFVNGVPQSSNIPGVPQPNPYVHVGYNQSGIISVSLCNGWQPGRNTLVVQVVSGAPFAGFLAQTSINPPPPATFTDSVAICEGDVYDFNGQQLTIPGVYTETFINSFGCDSTVELTLTNVFPTVTAATAQSCNPADTGVVVLNLLNQFGCDSTHTITTTLLPSDSTTASQTTCSSANAGVEVFNLTNQFGCDSVHTVTTTLLPSDSTFATIGSCNPADTGVVVTNSINQSGCDSVHVLTTTLLPESTTFSQATSCNPADTGVVVLNLFNQFGCDSVHTVTTTLLPSNTSSEQQSSCNPADTGVVVLNLTNQFGCDSLHTITTTLLRSDSTQTLLNTCFANEAGEFSETFSNEFGCDSVHTTTIELLVNPYAVAPQFAVIRAGETLDYSIANSDDNLEFSWIATDATTCNPPCTDFSVTPTELVTRYFFTFTDTATGCISNDTMRIDIEYFSELNVPNIFTPNGDGQNDIFRVYGTDIFEFSMMIFDRWGGKMFETTNLNEGWDGNFKNQPVASGVYIVLIKATGQDARKYDITQNIRLVR